MIPPESPALGGARAARVAQRVFPLAVLLLVVAYGAARLTAFVAAERASWAPAAAIAFAVLLIAILGIGLALRASAFELAFGALAWTFGAAIVCALSPYPTALRAGSGPYQAPVYLALSLLGGLYALGWPRFLARPSSPSARACLLLLVWTTADLRMLQRDGESALPLLAAGVLLVLGVHARLRGREWLGGPGRSLVAVLAALLFWWWLAVIFGDSPRRGVTVFSHLLSGVLLAWALAGSLDERGAHRAVVGLVVGLLASLALLSASVLEMLPYNDLARILGSRLRLFDTYSNQIAPLFAGGACLLLPLARGRPGQPSALGLPRWLVILTAIACLGVLAWTRSRGGMAAFAVGAAIALAASGGHLPRRPLRAAVAAAVLVAAGAALFASPLGDGLRAELDRRTFGQSAIGQRYHYWRSAAAAVADHPLFGLGPGQYYAHARYAQPSFYDGAYQEVHPHSLLFAAAESAGLPGLLLFLLFVAGLLELGRRRVLGSESAAERRLWAGLYGAVCAALAADVFDLAQSGATMIPLILWCALGLYAAGSGSAAPPSPHPSRSPLACALAALFLLPLAALPLCGQAAVAWGDVLLDRGQPWRASRVFRLAAPLHPWNPKLPRGELLAIRNFDQPERTLELYEAEACATPGRLGAWILYGRELLRLGRAEEALAVLDGAVSIDPRGHRTGELTMYRAWARLELGREEEARELLLEGLIQPGGDWRPLPQEPLPARPGDPPGAARFAFRLGGDPERLIPFDDVLEQLGRRMLDQIEVDHVVARRMLGRLSEGYLAQGLPGAALDFVRQYTSRVAPMASIQMREVELLGRLGDYAGAAEAFRASPYVDHPYMIGTYLMAIRASADPEHQRDFVELPLDIGGGGTTDLFFSADVSAPVYELASERALLRGDAERALDLHRRALYHLNAAPRRIRLAREFFERAAELGRPNEVLLEALGILLREASRQPELARWGEGIRPWVETLRGAWEGDADGLPPDLERVLRRSGAAGRTFLEEWGATGPGA